MVRSFQATTIVAPMPGPLDNRIRSTARPQVLYAAYLDARVGGGFLAFCRSHYIGKNGVAARHRGQGRNVGKDTLAVGV